MKSPFGRGAREQMEFERVLWPGTEVFKNKLGIRDATALEKQERLHVANRLAEGLPPKALAINYVGFKAIHRHAEESNQYVMAGLEPAIQPPRVCAAKRLFVCCAGSPGQAR